MRTKKTVSFCISKDLLQELDAITGKRSAWIERAIKHQMERDKAEIKQQLQGR